MNTVIIYPPTADPTSPYISLPVLSAFLRSNGISVFPIDSNIEFYCRVFEKTTLSALCRRVERRTRDLLRHGKLSHEQALEISASPVYKRGFFTLPDRIAGAISVLRGSDFYDDAAYADAVDTVESALTVLSAAYHPVELNFSSYRAPFALMTAGEIERESEPERNPFFDYISEDLVPRLRKTGADVVGFSVAFTGQLQPAFSFAYTLSRLMPGIYLTAGGSALTQLASPHGAAAARFLGPFDSIVLFEGEDAFLRLLEALAAGKRPAGVISGGKNGDLGRLPPPDYDGLPLDLYLSPEPVLPFDFTRGCYWGNCAFCHYGLTPSGTALYRERPSVAAAKALSAASRRYGSRFFYLSGDTVAPAALERLFLTAKADRGTAFAYRWASDIRSEAALTVERVKLLRESGAIAFSVGVESGDDRVLRLMNKGIDVQTMRPVIRRISEAGIAAEVMCFSGFPGETYGEAMKTVEFLRELESCVSLFMFGEFSLARGSAVAAHPDDYDIEEIWTVTGDELGSALFFTPKRQWKSDKELMLLNDAILTLSKAWEMRSYPWAGSLSTAHTLLRYDRFGPAVFRSKETARQKERTAYLHQKPDRKFERFRHITETREAQVWNTMIYELKTVNRQLYEKLAGDLPPLSRTSSARFLRTAE